MSQKYLDILHHIDYDIDIPNTDHATKGENIMENSTRTYYYARVSSTGQNLARQLEAFHKMGATDREIITDKASGKDTDRTGYQALKGQLLRRGDTLVVTSLDRLSRTKADIKGELQYFHEQGIRLKVLDLPTTMTELPEGQAWIMDMVTNILVEVMASMAEQERANIRKRQREGLDAMTLDEKGRRISAKKGTHAGRPDTPKPDNWDEVIKRWKAGKVTGREAMKELGLTKSTFYRMVKEAVR